MSCFNAVEIEVVTKMGLNEENSDHINNRVQVK